MDTQPFYKKHPFLRILFPLLLGIILSQIIGPNQVLFYTIALLVAICLILILLVKTNIHSDYFKGLLINLLFLSIGFCNHSIHISKINSSKQPSENIILATIEEIPVRKNKTYKSTLSIEGIKNAKNWLPQQSKVIAYFENDPLIEQVKAGQQIIFSAQIAAVSNHKNTIGFDYAKYLSLKGIESSVYIPSGNWELLKAKPKGIKAFALNLRARIIDQYKKAGIANDELGVLAALTVGYKNNLSANIRSAYSGAGAMHVLAVSGLHVGIIFFILNALLSFVKFFKKLLRLKFLLIILFLWFYALLTGLSPSVTRATVMFTFILVGHLLNKQINIYNSLAASAFLLLMINPNYLFEVGFQLSYIAVLGIVFFQPKIYRIVHSRWWLFDKTWELTSVSLAAQLVTFPLSIYYFHQFPVYFWFSNIVVILAAMFLIYLTLFLFVFQPFHLAHDFIGSTISYLLKLNNDFIYWINDLPQAVISQISVNQMQIILLYSMLIFFAFWVTNANKKIAFSTLLLCLIFTATSSFKSITEQKQSFFNIFHLKRESLIQWINGKEMIALSNSNFETQNSQRLLNDAVTFWNIEEVKTYDLNEIKDSTIHFHKFYYNKGFWKFGNQSGLILHKDSKTPRPATEIVLDYLIVTESPPFKKKDLKNLEFKKIIIDGSVPPWVLKNWRVGSSVHNTEESGAFIVDVSINYE